MHSLVVVTRNLSDFEATGAALLNPWQGGSAVVAGRHCEGGAQRLGALIAEAAADAGGVGGLTIAELRDQGRR